MSGSALRFVYLGIVVPAPDVPPRPMVVQRVFGNEADAEAWKIEGPPPSSNSSYRRVEKREVE